jgi:hypothetical protein
MSLFSSSYLDLANVAAQRVVRQLALFTSMGLDGLLH